MFWLVHFVLQICLIEAGFACVCKRWIHKGNCRLYAQSSVLPIRILAVCRVGLGGIKNGKSSKAWPHPWAGHWCLQAVAILEPCGIRSARKREIGVSTAFPALCYRELMVQPARQSEEGLQSHHQVLIQYFLLNGTFR